MYIPRRALQLLDTIHPGISHQYLKLKSEDSDGKCTAIVNNAQPPRDPEDKAAIPRQYLAPLEKESKAINANMAMADDKDDASNDSEDTHPDPEDQIEDQTDQLSQIMKALAALTNTRAAFLNVKCHYEYLDHLAYLFA